MLIEGEKVANELGSWMKEKKNYVEVLTIPIRSS